MKTSHLSIITGIGIASVIFFALILVIIPSSLADQAGLSIDVEQNEVGVGEPITFFVEISSPLQSSMYPTAVIVDEQNRTVWGDDDLPPNGYKGMTKVYYVQRDSENVPVINQTGKYTLIVTFADKRASKDLTVTGTIRENGMLHYYGAYTGIDKENADIEIADQSYYLTTVHKTPSDLTAPNDTIIQFHGVAFTFPGCGQCLPIPTVSDPPYYVHVQFQDKTNETLEIRDNQWSTIGPPMDFHEYLANGTKIFPNGTKSTWAPRFHMDPIITIFSNHEHPKAGITVTHDSMKFLVSVENNSSQQSVLGNTVNSTASENQSQVSQLGNHWYGGGGPVVTITLDPLEQFKSGVAPKDIKCNTGFILVLKQDYTPSCIKEPSAIKLFLRGWIFGFADYQPVYFMKHNMHAEISVKYSPSNHGSMSSDLLDLYPRAYSKTNSNYPTDAIYANANPDMVSQNVDTVVKYTVIAQNDTRGVYWLSLSNICELVPIAVDIDESNLTISDLQNPTTAWKCPGSTMQYHVIGVSGVTVGLVQIRN